MTSDNKKALLLLESTVFHYHGLDDNEKKLLKENASSIGGEEELNWVYEFISKDYFTAFERAKKYLVAELGNLAKDDKLELIRKVWAATSKKGNGNITEMEARALLNIAKEFGIESELLNLIRTGQMN